MMFFRSRLKIFIIIFALCSAVFGFAKEARAALQGDGISVYGKSGVAAPQYRLWNAGSQSWGPETVVGGATFSVVPRYVIVKTSPVVREEAIVGTLNSNGDLIITRWNGTAWSQLGSSLIVQTNDTAVFDIAYEQTSGKAMIVTVAAGSADPFFATWDGTTWSGWASIPQATKTTGAIRWVKLASRKTSGSNEIALAYADANGDFNALVWSGSAWTEQTAVAGALSTAIENNGGATTMRAFDLAYESLSGDLLIVWGNNGTVDPRYVTRSAAGAWSGVLTASTFTEIPSLVSVSAEPWGNRITVQTQDDTTANSNDGDCGIWDGTAWANTVNCDITRDSQEAGDMVLGNGWVNNGTDTRALNFYSDANAGATGGDLTLDYHFWVPGTGWTVSQSFPPSPNCIAADSDDNSFVVDHNPFNNAEIMIMRQAGSGICAQKTTYAGVNTFNFGNAGDGSSLGTVSVAQYQPVGFSYFQFIPSAVVTVSTAGTQTPQVVEGQNDAFIGTFTFLASAPGASLTSIKISEKGSVNANLNLADVKLFEQEEATCTSAGASPLGAPQAFNVSDEASFSGLSLSVSNVTQRCIFVYVDVGSAAGGGNKIEIEITVAGDIGVSGGTVAGTFPVQVAGNTNIGADQGTVMSGPIDFDWRTGQAGWGQVIWAADETQGDVKIQVYRKNIADCDTIVSNTVLTGNGVEGSGGYDTTTIDLSPLNAEVATTYNRLCLKATLTAGATASPVLQDWQITWQPLVVGGNIQQSGYRFFADTTGTLDVGAPLAGANTPASLAVNGDKFRLRMLIHVNTTPLAINGEAVGFKLQSAPRSGTCDTAFAGETYTDITAATPIGFANNPEPALVDGAVPLIINANDPPHGADVLRRQTYEELNNFNNSQSAIAVGEDGLWDFALVDLSAPSGAVYCIRAVRADGGSTQLDAYLLSSIPEITMGVTYPSTGTYTSNDINIPSLRAWNVLEWNWEINPACAVPSPCNLRLQIRTATTQAGLATALWSGDAGAGTFYQGPAGTSVTNRVRIPVAHNTHQWIRYQVLFDSNGAYTPILNRVRINYQ